MSESAMTLRAGKIITVADGVVIPSGASWLSGEIDVSDCKDFGVGFHMACASVEASADLNLHLAMNQTIYVKSVAVAEGWTPESGDFGDGGGYAKVEGYPSSRSKVKIKDLADIGAQTWYVWMAGR